MFCPKCGTENPETGKYCRSCGTDIGVVSKALEKKSFSGDDYGWDADDYSMTGYDDEGNKLKTPEDFFGNGIKEICGGIAFVIIAGLLFFTNILGGSIWGFWLLIPGGFMIGNGISNIYKSKKLEQRMGLSSGGKNLIDQSEKKAELPPSQTDYVSPDTDVKYDTGDLVPPSVTENTTRHLEMDSEGETMTLPKKDV